MIFIEFLTVAAMKVIVFSNVTPNFFIVFSSNEFLIAVTIKVIVFSNVTPKFFIVFSSNEFLISNYEGYCIFECDIEFFHSVLEQ